jgi:NADP-dependent aldehyde dehydrogenase
MADIEEHILVAGVWREAVASGTFRAIEPATGHARPEAWPVSRWADVEAALDAATAAAAELRGLPAATLGEFLVRYAARLEAAAGDLVAVAAAESGLAERPRLAEVELPRTLDQLRQAASAAAESTWRMAMIDARRNIRSAAFGLGPVVVFPPGNCPLAYGAVTGGDFAAAIAAGNPVIAKAHPALPGVSRLAARLAFEAVRETGLPPATVQLLHGLEPGDGERLVADPRVGASGFTGGEAAGRRLYAAACAAGNVMWVEMGSVNPVVLLPGALAARGAEIAGELTASVTGSAGQFCTKPGLVFIVADAAGRRFIANLADRFGAIGPQVLLGPGGLGRLEAALAGLRQAGARRLVGADAAANPGGPCVHAPTLLEISGAEFLAAPRSFVVEAFGNATLLVACADAAELGRAVVHVRGSLAASLYAADDDAGIRAGVEAVLVARAGRIVENRMPTGLAVTPPMQHGGPWPSAGPPFFSAVGMPWSILRFARRICFDGWSSERLPDCLRDEVPPGRPWRFIDGAWTRAAVRPA